MKTISLCVFCLLVGKKEFLEKTFYGIYRAVKELISFIAITIFILLIFLLAIGFLPVAIISLPVCISAITVMLLVLYLFRIQKINHLNLHGVLAKVLTVHFDGEKLDWELENTKIDSYAKAKAATLCSIIMGMLSVWLLLIMVTKTGIINNNTGYSPATNHAVSYIFSGIVIMATVIKIKPVKTLKYAIWERAITLVEQINVTLERTHELASLENSIKALASQLKTSFPSDFRTDIQEFVNLHKEELITDATDLNRLVAKNIERAENDLIKLQEANKHYGAAMKLYTVVAIEVNWTCSIPLIKEMEYYYEGLTSENLKSLLSDKKWDEFHEIVDEIMMDLSQLRDLAIKYQEETLGEDFCNNKNIADDEKAYHTLEITPAATIPEIKNAYRRLALSYHPDNAEQTTDSIRKLAEERFKEINWAYNTLRKSRNF
ncbi:MAG: J domain-containing protein [Candidatus Kuenenia sp.]|nr:J domain-containing protein [Candidatus Kuenenia hertensis]